MLDERRHDPGAHLHGLGLGLSAKLIVPRLALPIAADDDEPPYPRRHPVARQPDDRADEERAVGRAVEEKAAASA